MHNGKRFKKNTTIATMERYMLHLENKSYLPRNSRSLVHKARDLCRGMVASIRVCRVASSFVELDVSINAEDLDRVVKRLESIGRLDNARHVTVEDVPKDDGIRDGIFYYNHERFWEAHEAWEGSWKMSKGREKLLLQGLILLAVSFAHCQKNDESIGIRMLNRVQEKIGDYTGTYHGIDIDRIKSKTAIMKREKKLVRFEI